MALRQPQVSEITIGEKGDASAGCIKKKRKETLADITKAASGRNRKQGNFLYTGKAAKAVQFW